MHKLQRLRLLVTGSQQAEVAATEDCGIFAELTRERLVAMGVPPQGPIFVGTDNITNALVASTQGSPKKSRHILRRYYAFMQRVRAGDVSIFHITDKENPSDFMTKWLAAAKFYTSVAYATNSAARVRSTAAVPSTP